MPISIWTKASSAAAASLLDGSLMPAGDRYSFSWVGGLIFITRSVDERQPSAFSNVDVRLMWNSRPGSNTGGGGGVVMLTRPQDTRTRSG